jgi:hypothetical protein
VTRFFTSARPDQPQTTWPFLRSTLPVMPGSNTITSGIFSGIGRSLQ